MKPTFTHKDRGAQGIFFMKDNLNIISELTYIKKHDVITINRTKTKKPLEGKGLASQLVSRIVEYARDNEFKINPLCPFSEVQFERNPDYRDVLMS